MKHSILSSLKKFVRLNHSHRPAYALATILILMGVVLFGAGALVTISTIERKIAYSQQEGITAYMVAEAAHSEALWRLNTTPAYSSALLAGTLNIQFTATDSPLSGQGYTVRMVSTSAGNATIDVDSTVDNGNFIARRALRSQVFSGPVSSPISDKVIYSGADIGFNNGSSNIITSNGNIYARTTINLNNTNIQAGTGFIQAVGNYSANNSTVNSAGIRSANNPPAPADIPAPSVDFSGYQTSANSTYATGTAFINAIANGGSTVNFPGPITYVNGNVAFGNSVRNKTVNITGLLVVNGTVTTNSSVSGLRINFTDPGNAKAGLLAANNITFNSGTFNIAGVIYSAGTIRFISAPSVTLNGGVVAGSSIQVNPGSVFNLTGNSTRMSTMFGGGTPSAVQVQHWEEEY